MAATLCRAGYMLGFVTLFWCTSGFVDDVVFTQWALLRVTCIFKRREDSVSCVTAEIAAPIPTKFCLTSTIKTGNYSSWWVAYRGEVCHVPLPCCRHVMTTLAPGADPYLGTNHTEHLLFSTSPSWPIDYKIVRNLWATAINHDGFVWQPEAWDPLKQWGAHGTSLRKSPYRETILQQQSVIWLCPWRRSLLR